LELNNVKTLAYPNTNQFGAKIQQLKQISLFLTYYFAFYKIFFFNTIALPSLLIPANIFRSKI